MSFGNDTWRFMGSHEGRDTPIYRLCTVYRESEDLSKLGLRVHRHMRVFHHDTSNPVCKLNYIYPPWHLGPVLTVEGNPNKLRVEVQS